MIFNSATATYAVTANQVVIVMKSNCIRSVQFSSDNRDPVKSEIMSAPGMKDAGKANALSIVRDFNWHTNASVAASATGDGGVALEFIGEDGRQIDVVVPDEGKPCYFVASRASERSTGVIDGPEGALPLCKWLHQGGELPGNPLPLKA